MKVIKLTDLELTDKRVFMRVDFNIPMHEGKISDDTRMRASLPGIKHALAHRARLMLVSHLNRPAEGVISEADSLAPIAKHLSSLLGVKVPLIRDWVDGVEVEPGKVVMLENCRFNVGEKNDDDALAKKLAKLCDIYVNDAFGAAHRAEVTTHGIGKYAKIACAGPLMAAEIDALTHALQQPGRPMIAIVGGSKVSTKLTILAALAEKVDQLIVGGGIANTFLLAAGKKIGKSLAEPGLTGEALKIMDIMKHKGGGLPLPMDVVCAKTSAADAQAETKSVDEVTADDLILDIGPQTASEYAFLLARAGTVVWNGPIGVFEHDQFGGGTRMLAEAIANSRAFSLVGGGDTIAAVTKYGVADKISYISTGGGAFLEFLEGKKLPAVDILEIRA